MDLRRGIKHYSDKCQKQFYELVGKDEVIERLTREVLDNKAAVVRLGAMVTDLRAENASLQRELNYYRESSDLPPPSNDDTF